MLPLLPDSDPFHPSPRPDRSEPLIPILAVDDALHDPIALATWHEALSDALRIEVPHDLLALWLFPFAGGAVLLGPAALADDRLTVPLPSPMLARTELEALESRVRGAGYGSAVAIPVRVGRRDVGLLFVADLRPDRLREVEHALLRLVTRRLAPTLGRLARLWTATSADVPAEKLATADHFIVGWSLAFVDALGHALKEAAVPRAFAAALSESLSAVLPHDHLELLVSAPAGRRWLRLGEQVGTRLWADPALVIEHKMFDIDALFEDSSTGRDLLLLPDVCADDRWPRGYLTTDGSGAEIRGIVAARVTMPNAQAVYLLLGSVGPDFYRADDAILLARVATLILPRIEGFLRSAPAAPSAPVARDRLVGRHPLAAVAELLAMTADTTDALRLAAEEAQLLLPFGRAQYVVRLVDGDRVVLLTPGERRPLPDLPLVPIANAFFAEVVRGAAPHALQVGDGESRLAVPLRVGGYTHGAVVLVAPRPDGFDAAAVTLAQRFADLIAPHIELLRRAALIPPPYVPGWKRSGR